MEDPYPSRRPGLGRGTPALLPRREPVVYSDWCDSAPLSRAQSRAFDQQGYLVLDGLFSAAEVSRLQDEAQQLQSDPSGLDPRTIITEPGSDAVRSIFRIHHQGSGLGRLAGDPRLTGIARYLLDDAIYVHQSRLNTKPGFQGREFYWHSDFETWHVEDGMPRMRALSMSILLARNDALNGPLMLMPGSHRHFVPCIGQTPDNHYRTSLRRQEYGVPDEDNLRRLATAGGIVAPTGPAGTVVIFDCNMMHGSNGNITPFPRSNAFIVYNAMSNRLVAPFAGTPPRPDFIAARSARAIAAAPGHAEMAA